MSENFVPPTHWISPEELDEAYWKNPQNLERRGQEFYDKPIETIGFIDRFDKEGIARRDFLTLMGASMAMAGVSCVRRPVHKIIPYVVQPEEITPGVANWYASTIPETGLGILVKTREGRPIKLEGNPEHPLSRGSLSAREQATILDLYDPDRLKEPWMRERTTGEKRKAEWSEVDRLIEERLKSSKNIRILSGWVTGDSTFKLISEFLSHFGLSSQAHIQFDPLFPEELVRAQVESYGTSVIPKYDFSKADLIVSLGADFLGTWGNPSIQAQEWSKKRKLINKTLSKLVSFESSFSLTGANSDERHPIRPGDELKIAMALAHELVFRHGASHFGATALLSTYKPADIAQEIGLSGGAKILQDIATHLWRERGKSLVLAGGLSSRTENAVQLQIAVNFLNSILGNDGTSVDGTAYARSVSGKGFSDLSKLISDMKSGQVDFLIIHRTNPQYFLPKSLEFEAALKKVRSVIVVSEKYDETARHADFILPDHHFLENWGDHHPQKEVYSLQQPTIAPLHSSRSFQESLMVWSHSSKKSWHEYLKENWKTIYKKYKIAGSFEQFWEEILSKGVFEPSKPVPHVRVFNPKSFSLIKPYQPNFQDEPQLTRGGLQLVLYSKISMHDGTQANNAWLQEMPDPISTVTWDNYLNLSPALAKAYGIEPNDVLELKLRDSSFHVPALIQPGMHPRVVSLAVGYGRVAVGKVGNDVGVNAFSLAHLQEAELIYSGQVVSIRKTGEFYKLAETQWHHASENRPIINDITLAQYQKKPEASQHTDPHLRMESVPTLWPQHEYKGHRWGMSIDLNSCTGCGACVVACQAENNIPVVGRNNVRVSREMHWIRIDRYYSGKPENPDLVFQPMLCQHCENAPCETVCPVLATVHNSEGLNEQVYNRCVGTRYCQNNCPYKVRRFNFFDHWKNFEGNQNLAWNPDVTVRTRGIMEKCTFCVQRIRDGKESAKETSAPLKDGDIKTACQQTCPTQAIVFGDINDPTTQVSKNKADPRSFRVLELLNTKPSISYLTKVRNKESNHHG